MRNLEAWPISDMNKRESMSQGILPCYDSRHNHPGGCFAHELGLRNRYIRIAMHIHSSEGTSKAQAEASSEVQPIGRRTRMLIDALAGAISGCISRVVVGPLDVIKIRFQVGDPCMNDDPSILPWRHPGLPYTHGQSLGPHPGCPS